MLSQRFLFISTTNPFRHHPGTRVSCCRAVSTDQGTCIPNKIKTALIRLLRTQTVPVWPLPALYNDWAFAIDTSLGCTTTLLTRTVVRRALSNIQQCWSILPLHLSFAAGAAWVRAGLHGAGSRRSAANAVTTPHLARRVFCFVSCTAFIFTDKSSP